MFGELMLLSGIIIVLYTIALWFVLWWMDNKMGKGEKNGKPFQRKPK